MASKRDSTSAVGPPSTKKAKPILTINDYNRDYQDSKADVTLISANGLHFKVHSYVLKAASVVFRDMFTVATDEEEREITLTDSTIEKSKILASFLDIIYGREMSLPSNDIEGIAYRHCQDLINLATKYDSSLVLRYLNASIYQWYYAERLDSEEVMILGFTLDKPEMVAFAIRNGDTELWFPSRTATEEEKVRHKDPVRTLEHVRGIHWLSLNSWDLESFKEVPDDYKFALLRATHGKINHPNLTKAEVGEIADRFLQIMKEMGKIR